MADRYVIGADIGGTRVRIGWLSEQGELQGFTVAPSAQVLTAGHPLEGLASYIKKYWQNLQMEPPAAVCVGFPATLDQRKQYIVNAPNLSGLDGLPAAEILSQALECPVYINKDVNLLLYHDLHTHGLEQAGSVIGCYVGTGLGNALYLHGEIWEGAHGAAGELGHIPLSGNTLRCGCGNTGCAETVASGMRLQSLRARNWPETEIGKVFCEHGEDDILREYVAGLAIPIAAEINILDPESVILGGGVVGMDGFPRDWLEQCIRIHARKPQPYESLKIYYSAATQQSGVQGAGIYAFRQLKKEREE